MDLFLFAFLLLAIPVFVFRLMTVGKEKGVPLYVHEEGSGARARLGLSVVAVGVASLIVLCIYLVFCQIVPSFDGRSGVREWGGRIADMHFTGGLLVCMAISGVLGIAPAAVAHCLGYRLAARVWVALAIAVVAPYVGYVCMELMR